MKTRLCLVLFIDAIIAVSCAAPMTKAEPESTPVTQSLRATPASTPVSTRIPQVIGGCTLPAGEWFTSTYLHSWREWDKKALEYTVPVVIPGTKVSRFSLVYEPRNNEVVLYLTPSTGGIRPYVMERKIVTPGQLLVIVPGVNIGDVQNTNRLAGPIYVYSCDGTTVFVDDEYKSRFITTDFCPQFAGWWDWKKLPTQGLVITSEDDEITVSVESVGVDSSNLKYVHKDGNEQVFISPNSFDGVIFFGGNQYVHFWTCSDGVYYRRLPKDLAPPTQEPPPSGKKS